MESYITVASNDISAIGCLVLCNSLKQSGTDKQISVIISASISANLKSLIERSFDNVFNEGELEGSANHPMNYELTKLKIWLLIQFKKCVFLESDTLVMENIDSLFERSELSAVVNSKFLCFFDTGLLVIEPNKETYERLIREFSKTGSPSFSWILNSYFSTWGLCVDPTKRIPFVYNCQLSTSSTFYTQSTSLVQYGSHIKVARLGEDVNSTSQNILSRGHNASTDGSLDSTNFTGNNKGQILKDIWCQWWRIYSEKVFPAMKNNGSYSFKRVGIDYSLDGSDSHLVTRDLPPPQPPAIEPSAPPTHHIYYQPQPEQQQHQEPTQYHEDESQASHKQPETIEEVNSQEETNQVVQPNPEFTEDPQPAHAQEFNDIPVTSVTHVTNVTDIPSSDTAQERERWERGEIDYMGRDRSNNIMAVLEKNINGAKDKCDEQKEGKMASETKVKPNKETSNNCKKYKQEYTDKIGASNYIKVDKTPIKSGKSKKTKETEKMQKQIANDKKYDYRNNLTSMSNKAGLLAVPSSRKSAIRHNDEEIRDKAINNNEIDLKAVNKIGYELEVSEEEVHREPDEHEIMNILGYREE